MPRSFARARGPSSPFFPPPFSLSLARVQPRSPALRRGLSLPPRLSIFFDPKKNQREKNHRGALVPHFFSPLLAAPERDAGPRPDLVFGRGAGPRRRDERRDLTPRVAPLAREARASCLTKEGGFEETKTTRARLALPVSRSGVLVLVAVGWLARDKDEGAGR